jgi:hypothetical protein
MREEGRFQISDFRFQISDFRFQISDFRWQMADGHKAATGGRAVWKEELEVRS